MTRLFVPTKRDKKRVPTTETNETRCKQPRQENRVQTTATPCTKTFVSKIVGGVENPIQYVVIPNFSHNAKQKQYGVSHLERPLKSVCFGFSGVFP